MRSAVALYCIVIGVVMVGWWSLDVRDGALERPDRSRSEIGLHLAAELLTAALLFVGGVNLLVADSAGVALVGLGMLAYTVIQSPGYFLARGERGPVAMFVLLGVATALAVPALLLS